MRRLTDSHPVAGALLFSFISLYIFSVILVIWKPNEDAYEASSAAATNSTASGAAADTHSRHESAVIANSTMISVLALVGIASGFSYIGDYIVKLLLDVVEQPSTSDPQTAKFLVATQLAARDCLVAGGKNKRNDFSNI